MRRICLLLAILSPAVPLIAQTQQWVAGANVPIVQRAAEHRGASAADTTLANWRAKATGILRYSFSATGAEVASPVVSRIDELVLDVYGKLPDQAKQFIRQWRDTTLFPTPFSAYHRDHLGIVANDFGGTIRLGDGDEVRNLIHPLSAAGLAYYLFAPGDTVTIATGQGTTRVQLVEVRPRDLHTAGTIGTLYIDIDRAALVRFRFTFTPESYLDGTVRDITVTLESALLSNALWLPWRQSIVIRRLRRWMDRVDQSMIRADWELSDYTLGDRSADSLFRAGVDSLPSISGPTRSFFAPRNLPPVAEDARKLPPPEDGVVETQEQGSELAEGRRLDGSRRTLKSTGGLITLNRVQGYAVSTGITFPVGKTLTAFASAGYGFSDERPFGMLKLEGPLARATWLLRGERTVEDVGDISAVPRLIDALIRTLSGHDYGDWTLIDRAGAGIRFPARHLQVALSLDEEWSRSVRTDYFARYYDSPSNAPLGIGRATVARAAFTRNFGNRDEVALRLEGGHGDADWRRAAMSARLYQSAGFGTLALGFDGGAGSAELPGYRNFVLGGSTTLPGVPFRSIGGRQMAIANLGYEMRLVVPDFLRSSRVRQTEVNTVTPFVASGIAWGDNPLAPWRATHRIETSVGLRLNLGGGIEFSIAKTLRKLPARKDEPIQP